MSFVHLASESRTCNQEREREGDEKEIEIEIKAHATNESVKNI